MRARTLRAGCAGALLLSLCVVPLLWMLRIGGGLHGAAGAALAGFAAAVDAVGWVVIPQLLLGIAIFGAAIQQLAARLAGVTRPPAPIWIDPAVESELLLGLLGTVSGMVDGFVGLSPDLIEPGPLVHGLGTALRSSVVGFSIALVGVWVRALPAPTAEAS